MNAERITGKTKLILHDKYVFIKRKDTPYWGLNGVWACEKHFIFENAEKAYEFYSGYDKS
jgi:hypothetical protein